MHVKQQQPSLAGGGWYYYFASQFFFPSTLAKKQCSLINQVSQPTEKQNIT
jgi:hypothetical protein